MNRIFKKFTIFLILIILSLQPIYAQTEFSNDELISDEATTEDSSQKEENYGTFEEDDNESGMSEEIPDEYFDEDFNLNEENDSRDDEESIIQDNDDHEIEDSE